MTVSQLIESVMGKNCALEGSYGDATPFSELTDKPEELCEKLGLKGFEPTGTEVFVNGMTGEVMGTYTVGVVFYQLLKHLVSEKMHARATGPITAFSRQPLEGRSKEGGLRFGEMEQQAQIAVGAAKFLQERLFLQSDEFKMGLCTRCGNFATTAGYCKSCDDDEVVSLNLPYISKLVFQELQAMLIKTKISIKE